MSIVNLQARTQDETLIKLCQQYWQIDTSGQFIYTVASLAKTFGVPSNKIPKLVEQNCVAASTSIKCATCSRPYVYSSRADYQTRSRYPARQYWICHNCTHQSQRKQQEERLSQEQQQRELLRIRFDPSKFSLSDPSQLSLEDAVYYLSVIRLGASEDFTQINPAYTFPSRLTTSEEFDTEVIVHLYQNEMIAIHPESRMDAFTISDNEIRYGPRNVTWSPLVAFERGAAQEAVEFLEYIFQVSLWRDEWKAEVESLGRRIALEECLEYLIHSMDEHHLPLKVGDKTKLVLNLALEHFSVAQIYNFIWRAARDAAAFYQRGGVTPHHAANTAVGTIQRMVERSRDEKWDVKAYGRSFALPRTMVSQVLFSTVLHIADGGFTTRPSDWSFPEIRSLEKELLQQEGVAAATPTEQLHTSNQKSSIPRSNNNRNRSSRNRKKRKR